MIDDDGIERPDSEDAHAINLPHIGKKKLETKKNIRNTNLIYKFGCYVFRLFALCVLWFMHVFIFRANTEGGKNRKPIKKDGAVLVMNHCHYLDLTFPGVSFMPTNMYTVTIPENFLIPVAGALVKALGGLPIPLTFSGLKLFKEVVGDVLKEKKLVLFFPEGSLWTYYRELRPFKEGAFRFAVENNKPISPSVITYRIKHKSLKKKSYKMTYSILEPIYPDTSLSTIQAIKKLKEETHKAMSLAINSKKGEDIYTKKYKRQLRLQKA